jgi:hypothetical protein
MVENARRHILQQVVACYSVTVHQLRNSGLQINSAPKLSTPMLTVSIPRTSFTIGIICSACGQLSLNTCNTDRQSCE